MNLVVAEIQTLWLRHDRKLLVLLYSNLLEIAYVPCTAGRDGELEQGQQASPVNNNDSALDTGRREVAVFLTQQVLSSSPANLIVCHVL